MHFLILWGISPSFASMATGRPECFVVMSTSTASMRPLPVAMPSVVSVPWRSHENLLRPAASNTINPRIYHFKWKIAALHEFSLPYKRISGTEVGLMIPLFL
jgi:hypothetical protein